MSLTGALLSGVSGLQAQSNAMGIISDNIANLNTIGYKTSNATFSTLVVNSAATTTYSPGGVQSGVFSNIGAQGTLQATSSPLDVAITGNGFFAVNSQGNGLGNNLYTRAGSFHQDVQGRLVNTAGLFLEGWALTSAGAISNVNQLQVVSVGTTNGVAVGTQNVTVGANLDSSTSIFAAGGGSDTTSTSLGVSSTTSLLGVPSLSTADDLTLTLNGSTYTLDLGSASSALTTGSGTAFSGTFDTLADLANLINSIPGMAGSVSTVSASNATMTISSPWAVTLGGTLAAGGTNSAALGGLSTITADYQPGDIQLGTANAAFNDPIEVFDALGTSHQLNLSFVHTGTNQWAYELYDSDSDVAGVATGRGLISAGTINFNGDGSLNSVVAYPATFTAANGSAVTTGATNQSIYNTTTDLPSAVTINWSNGASSSSIKFDLGTEGALGTGKTDGITQFASSFNKNFTNQDGAAVGLQTGVTIDQNGFVIASYSNGATQKLFQVPVTTFADPSALQAQDGNAYTQTVASGNFNWRIAATGGAGTIAPSSLEQSDADLGDQFAQMITTQTAYSANSKTITTSNQMLQELLQIIQG